MSSTDDKGMCQHEYLGEKVLPMVMHKASGRTGHLISEHRRLGKTDGFWVIWPESPRPSWHPAGVIVRVSR